LLAFRCFFFRSFYQSFLLARLVFRSLARDGPEGSLAKLGCGVGFVRFANVPYSERKGALE